MTWGVEMGKFSRRVAPAIAVGLMGLVLAACGAKGDDTSSDDGGGSGGDDSAAASVDFGTLKAPCGEGDATVKADEAGRGTDKLYLGTASDKGSQVRPGLLAEMYDAGKAFAEWCNARGGIQGLPIEIIDLDGKLFEVENAMANACKDAFAMVGGGNALDNLQFSGKPESDFHQCKLIDIPGFTNTPAKADSNGYVAAVPNRTSPRTTTFWQVFGEQHPEEIKKSVLVYSDAVKYNKDQIVSTLKAVGGWEVLDEINYPAVGNIDFKLVSQRVKASGAEVVNLVGEPQAAVSLLKAMDEDGIHPYVLGETNMYTDDLVQVADIADKMIVRTVMHPFEEADEWAGTQSYVDMIEAYRKDDPEARIAALGEQSTSAFLLFAVAASKCGSEGDKVISRECVMKQAKAVHEWDGGGMHATTDPGANKPTDCVMAIGIKDGAWARLWPEIGGADDDGEGYVCRPDATFELPDLVKQYEGQGKVDDTRDQ